MASYSPNLAITLPADGEFSGTWGQTTNTNLGTLLEQAISGYESQAMFAAADVTLSMSNGAYSMCRNMYIQCTGVMSQVNNLILPNNKKLYFIYNATTGGPGYAITVKTALGSSVSVPNGAKMALVCDGSGIIEAINNVNFTNLSITGLTASGNVTAAAFIPTGSTVPTNGVYLPSANVVGFATNGVTRGNIGNSGAWTIAAPITAGNHIVNLLAGSNGIAFTTGSHTVNLYSDGSTQYLFGTSTNIPFKFVCNNVVVGTLATTGGWSIAAPTSGVAFTVNGIAGTHSTQIADNNNSKFDAGYLGIPQNSQTAAYAPTLQDRGKHVSITTGGVTINANPFTYGTTSATTWTAGDSFVIFNNSGSSQNITAGASVTFRLAGTATTGTPRTLAQYGVATCLCVTGGATPTFVISGAGVA